MGLFIFVWPKESAEALLAFAQQLKSITVLKEELREPVKDGWHRTGDVGLSDCWKFQQLVS